MVDSVFISYIPFLQMAACMLLLLPAPLLAAHRMQAAIAVLAILMAGAFIQLIWRADTSLVSLFLLPGMALLIAAPLLERARFIGVVVASLAGSAAALYAIPELLAPHLPERLPLSLLPLAMVATLVAGMAGGMKLPLHPQRHSDQGAIWHAAPQAVMLIGWALFAVALVGLCGSEKLSMAHLASALVAGLWALLQTQSEHAQDTLQKTGEGLVAGFLIVLLAPLEPMQASFAGLAAGFFVTRSEAIALSLRLDDPHHFLGALFIPAVLGLLLPGLLDLNLLAAQLQWLGATLLLGLGIAAVIWPCTMALFGVALPPRLVREGPKRR